MLKKEENKNNNVSMKEKEYQKLIETLKLEWDREYSLFFYNVEKFLLKEKYSLKNNVGKIKKEDLVRYMDHYIQLIEASSLLDIIDAIKVLDEIIK